MPSCRKPRKPHKQREARRDIAALIFEGDQPLPDDTRTMLLMPFRDAIGRILREEAPLSCWKRIVDGLNTAAALCKQAGNSEVGLAVIYAGQNAMISVRERFHRTNKLRFGADELPAVNEAADLYEHLMTVMTKRQHTTAIRECERRQRFGDVVKVKPSGTKRLGTAQPITL